jgi:MFS family permease
LPEPRDNGFLNRDFALICSSNFLAFFSIYLIIPVLPVFLEEEKGYSNFIIGALMSMMVVAALLRPFLGRVSDRKGRKSILVIGTLVLALTNFLYASFTTALPLFVVRFLNGFGLAAFHTAAYALVGDLAPPSRRLQGIAFFYMSVDVTIATAPVAAEAIKNKWGYPPVYIAAGIIAALSFAASLGVRERWTRPEGTGSFRLWRARPDLMQAAIFTATVGFTLTLGSLSTFVVLSAAEAGISQGELFFTFFAAALILYRLAVGRRADRWSRRRLILASGIISLAGLATIAVSSSLALFLAGSTVYGIGFAYIPTTLSALLLDGTRERNRGVMLGLFSAVFDVGMGLGGMAMGPVADLLGYRAMYLIGGGIALLSLLFFAAGTMHRGKRLPSRRPGADTRAKGSRSRRGEPG